ncbi:MAG: Lrp/AsnC family transcriptional regulator, partial [Syntrophomonadaceae bacterium]|nr:Lrp/AsnC family transcriptional regulator [Syntrophomonadaceae bacterium]
RRLLTLLQREFPLVVDPWAELGQRLGIEAEEVLSRTRRLREAGVIRRLGAVFNTAGMGFYSTLCAANVPENRLEEAAALVNRLPGVTHNYQREGDYNLWFTLTAASREEAERQLADLERALGLPIVRLPARRVYKIDAVFSVEEDAQE